MELDDQKLLKDDSEEEETDSSSFMKYALKEDQNLREKNGQLFFPLHSKYLHEMYLHSKRFPETGEEREEVQRQLKDVLLQMNQKVTSGAFNYIFENAILKSLNSYKPEIIVVSLSMSFIKSLHQSNNNNFINGESTGQ